MTTIAGHALTPAQVATLDETIDYLRRFSGDSHWSLSRNCSPKGDGRPIHVREIYPQGGNYTSARRRTLARLYRLGVLRACEIEYTTTGELLGTPLSVSR